MAILIGSMFGALAAIFLLSRLALWLLKGLGDNERRLLIAHGVTYALAVGIAGFGFADGGQPQFLYAAGIYGVPTLLWLVVDFLGLKGRRLKAQSPN